MAYQSGVTKYRTLWPLPGGGGQFLKSLRSMLLQVEKNRTRDQMVAFIFKKFPNVESEKAARSYLLVLHSLGLAEFPRLRSRLTPEGKAFLETRDIAIIRRVLLERIVGVSDLVELIHEQPRRIGLLLAAMNERGFQWSTASQIRYRLRWMQECDMVKVNGNARQTYLLTKSMTESIEHASLGARAPKSRDRSATTRRPAGAMRS
jgi:hypothetical protein